MKYAGLIFSFLLIGSLQLIAGGDLKTETFRVYGNCGMCKSTIEKAASAVSGVKSATWDRETDMLTVTYHTSKVTLDKIKEAVAASGYDSDTHRATDEAYNKLHGCCQYDRPKS
jgi:periplasmic mercuric ion binding protein